MAMERVHYAAEVGWLEIWHVGDSSREEKKGDKGDAQRMNAAHGLTCWTL